MKLSEILTELNNPELTILNQYDNTVNWGADLPIEMVDAIIRYGRSKTVYGRKTITQRKAK